jgi:hypothetical protein
MQSTHTHSIDPDRPDFAVALSWILGLSAATFLAFVL